MKMTIEHYIATNSPDAVNEVLDKYGITKARDMSDLVKKVHFVVRKHKPSMIDLAKIDTPYKRLILASVQPEKAPEPEHKEAKVETKSNACGCKSSSDDEQNSNCSGCDGSSNATGDTIRVKKTTPVTEEAKTTPTTETAKDAAPATTKEVATTNTDTDKKEKTDYTMPLIVLGIVGLIAVVVIAKHK
jgi:hypothetical protein